MLAGDSLRAKFLDRTIPLKGASHAEVVEYSTDVPMRYTEFCALLADGRKVRLRDATQFVAASVDGSRRSFLLRGRQGRIELQADTDKPIGIVWPSTAKRKFVTRDGSQLVVRRWGRIFARNLSEFGREVDAGGMYALPQLQ
jgi:hypothetical protein